MKKFLFIALLSGCASSNNGSSSFDGGLGSAYLSIVAANDRVRTACGNTTVDGPCVKGSLISTDDRDEFKGLSEYGMENLADAVEQKVTGDSAGAQASLERAGGVVRALGGILDGLGVDR